MSDAGHIAARARSGGDDRRPRSREADLVPLHVVQRLAGNRAVNALVQRQVLDGDVTAGPGEELAAGPTRPVLRRGDLSVDVGVAQQKLNVCGADPRLEVDAEFGSRTERAVRAFQRAHGLQPSGVVDDATWVELDTAAPGGVIGADGQPTPVSTGQPADPTATIETGVHPLLRVGATGPAVSELHEKLNAEMGTSLPIALELDEAGSVGFDAMTETVVATFQRRERLLIDGVAGDQTWGRLDELVPGSMLGRREMFMSEQVRGERYFRGGFVKFDFEVEGEREAPTRLVIRVGYDYTVLDDLHDVPPRLTAGIRQIWNNFCAVETVPDQASSPRGPVPIHFEPTAGSDQQVTISRGPGPSNASHYYITPDMDLAMLAAHEFGHHIGLADEYQQTAADHERHTGEAVPIGEIHGAAPPAEIASELRSAIFSSPEAERGERTLEVIRRYDLQQGAFAQQVARRYVNQFGRVVTDDINDHIPQSQAEGSLTKRRLCTQPFMYNQPGLMEGAEAEGEDHRHNVEPRHVRHLVEFLAAAVGGVWEPRRR